MANSQAQNTMSWGFSSGLIVVLNIRTCEIMMTFRQDSAVTSLCFTENDNLAPRLLSGGADGHLVSWDLNNSTFKCKKKLFDKDTSFVHFVATDQTGEVILCGSHSGNGLRMLAFDEQEMGDYRLLKSRQGVLGKIKQVAFVNDKHVVVATDSPWGEVFNCWVWNDSASLRLSDRQSVKTKGQGRGRAANLQKVVLSDGERRFGGGLWADVVTIQGGSRLPLFWSLHKNSLVDKHFECFDRMRLETDSKYAKVAQCKRELTAAGLSNCGSFLFSGYSDGWLIKNFVETGQMVKKFKYCDSVKRFEESGRITHIFVDSVNSFIVFVQRERVVKADFFSGEVLAEWRQEGFCREGEEVGDCLAQCDQVNNLLVLASPSDRLAVLNWRKMVLVRLFALKKQKGVSCFTIAKRAKKILLASKDRRLGVYDIFSSDLLSVFKLDAVLQTVDIREDVWLMVGGFQGGRSVNLWKVENLDWKVQGEVDLPFESELSKLGGQWREAFLRPPSSEKNSRSSFQSKSK